MIKIDNISKSFGERKIIDKFSLNIEEGSMVSIMGESGKGKTTLLNLISLLEKPDSGLIVIDNISKFNKKNTMLMRRNVIGNLFQNYALLENETVKENLLMALEYKKVSNKKDAIANALKKVNLDGFENKKIYELSGGEQQRIAIARLYLQDVKYIFADEPTGNLDEKNKEIVFNLLRELCNSGKSVVFVTHDNDLAKRADKMILL
ncbi:ATP-binding cassette domain-containing protein [Clostridium tarantellae]|uniref:ATP-binding cassette domain-containing protein n=1 Tax=Clostridium tarantellae TaxID=39493 RepID=A0A6I1MYL6_9CLOT|nr:ATP-binding cassette domain-containing protein [Clostridium tarantellae]MPQ45209.1 ATP-binding cassette domain-containing protein [Clostridium tarantellae]